MGDKHLSEVLTANMIMECPNNKICIVSGVGSGKNYFIENVLMEHGNVLCVTSRRAKVNEMLLLDICEEKIDWDSYKEKIVVTTNFGIEKLVKNNKFSASRKKVIEYFDFIVIDEAHSIYADARFASSSFHVYSFIEYVIKNYPKKKVILMTGTEEPLKNYLEKDWVVYNFMKECINVVPKKIEFILKEDVVDIIEDLGEKGKAVYFSNSATDICSNGGKSLFSKISKVVSADEIGICMNMQKAAELGVKEECQNTRDLLIETGQLPSDKRILLTTSALKEGINIIDENIKTVFCESHILSDIQQFAGRIRTGIDTFYIISDAMQHSVSDEELNFMRLIGLYYVNQKYCDSVTKFLKEKILTSDKSFLLVTDYEASQFEVLNLMAEGDLSAWAAGGEAARLFIEYIEKINPHMIYNHMENCFAHNIMKNAETVRINKILKDSRWYNEIQAFCIENSIEFVDAKKQKDEEAIGAIVSLLENCCGRILALDEKDHFWNALISLTECGENTKLKTLNKRFERKGIPFLLSTVSTTRAGCSTRGIKVERISK